jgi:hypothetical protein
MKRSKFVEKIEREFGMDLGHIADRIKRWHDNKNKYYDILDGLEAINVPDKQDISVSGGYGLYVYAGGDGKLLTQIVRVFRTNGWKTEHSPPEKGADHWNAEYYQWVDGKKLPGVIDLKFSSTICKRVQTGTETKEVPVYETQCDDLVIEEPLHEEATVSQSDSNVIPLAGNGGHSSRVS